MRNLFVVFVALFIYIPFCHADDKSYDQLLREIEALKKENSALKHQVSGSITSQPIGESKLAEKSYEDEIDEDIEEIVVTATMTKKLIKNVGSSITVIPRKQIENSKANLVSDVLRQTPGLEVRRFGGIGGTTDVHIRGGTSDQTLVFMDGVQLNDPLTGNFNFADLTTDNIERIEILRGPQSTLYGADAMSGVINIITKKGKGPPRVGLSSEYGTRKTYKETVNLSGGTEEFDYSGSVSYLKTHGISVASSGDERDGYTNFTGSMQVGRNFLEDGRVDTMLRLLHSDVDLDTSSNTDDDNRRWKKDKVFFSTKAEKTLFDIWTPSILVSVNDTEGETLDLTGANSEGRTTTRLWRTLHQSNINLFDIDTLTFGFEYELQEGTNKKVTTEIPHKSTTNRAVFFQNQIRLFDSIDWTVGGRYDRNSSFGDHWTFRSTLSYNIEKIGTRVHGSWGEGFRAPDFFDLFSSTSGNPNIRPEESEGMDLGIEQQIIKDKLKLDFTYFGNSVTDLIATVKQPDGSSLKENVDRAELTGIESALTYNPFSALSIIGTYTYTDARDKEKHRQLRRIPRNRATLTMNAKPIEKLNVNLTGLMVRNRINSTTTSENLEDYWLANLSLRYKLSKLMTANVRAENLFDRDYKEIRKFNSLGRSIYTGVDFKF